MIRFYDGPCFMAASVGAFSTGLIKIYAGFSPGLDPEGFGCDFLIRRFSRLIQSNDNFASL